MKAQQPILFNFTTGQARRITYEEMSERMVAQRKRGVVATCEGLPVPSMVGTGTRSLRSPSAGDTQA